MMLYRIPVETKGVMMLLGVKSTVEKVWFQDSSSGDTVDGRNPANQLRLVVYPVICRVLYISGGAGFIPSS